MYNNHNQSIMKLAIASLALVTNPNAAFAQLRGNPTYEIPSLMKFIADVFEATGAEDAPTNYCPKSCNNHDDCQDCQGYPDCALAMGFGQGSGKSCCDWRKIKKIYDETGVYPEPTDEGICAL